MSLSQARGHSIAQLKLLRAAAERVRAREAEMDLQVAAAGACAPWSGEPLKKLSAWLERVIWKITPEVEAARAKEKKRRAVGAWKRMSEGQRKAALGGAFEQKKG